MPPSTKSDPVAWRSPKLSEKVVVSSEDMTGRKRKGVDWQYLGRRCVGFGWDGAWRSPKLVMAAGVEGGGGSEFVEAGQGETRRVELSK